MEHLQSYIQFSYARESARAYEGEGQGGTARERENSTLSRCPTLPLTLVRSCALARVAKLHIAPVRTCPWFRPSRPSCWYSGMSGAVGAAGSRINRAGVPGPLSVKSQV